MENWGLVTFSQSTLLFNDEQSTYKNRITIASVISHEFAHQASYLLDCDEISETHN